MEDSLARVARRRVRGDHGVPEADIRRRFDRSLDNLERVYKPLVDFWEVWDQSAAAVHARGEQRPMNKPIDREGVARAMKAAARIAIEGTCFEQSGVFNTAPASYDTPAEARPAPKKPRRRPAA